MVLLTITLTSRATAAALLAPPFQAWHDAAALTDPALVEPRVHRSECTQINVTETIKITYDPDPNADTPFQSKLTHTHANFNACQGINNRNNDPRAYISYLYY